MGETLRIRVGWDLLELNRTLMHDGSPLVLLGCGYTLRRVARIALAGGRRVVVTSRDPARLHQLADAGADVVRLDIEDAATLAALARAIPLGAHAVHSVPVLRSHDGLRDPTPRLLEAVAPRIARLVYLSSTGVYGETAVVDETSPAAPATDLQRLRVDAEENVRSAVPSSVVLRPAAIYGPGRGVHVMLEAGRYRLLGDGSQVVSRIHVDDLAALVHAAIDHPVDRAWPVADDHPATAAEVAGLVCERLGLDSPPRAGTEEIPGTMRFTRRVDGSAILEILGITLRYPTYREGIPAAIEAERLLRAESHLDASLGHVGGEDGVDLQDLVP